MFPIEFLSSRCARDSGSYDYCSSPDGLEELTIDQSYNKASALNKHFTDHFSVKISLAPLACLSSLKLLALSGPSATGLYRLTKRFDPEKRKKVISRNGDKTWPEWIQ